MPTRRSLHAERSLSYANGLGRLRDFCAHRRPATFKLLDSRQAACRREARCKRRHSVVVRAASPHQSRKPPFALPCLTPLEANVNRLICALRGSSGHFTIVACTLWTWAAHLLDAERVRFLLVTYSTTEQLSLRRVLNTAGLQHTRLKIQTHALPNLVRRVDGKGAFAPRRTVYAQRHAKVLYGALTSGARHCLIWDAEGWVPRDVNLSQLAAAYADEPFILHEPLDALAASSHAYAKLQSATARWLGEGRRGAANLSRWYGYSFGYWWLVDVRVLWQLHAHVKQARQLAPPSIIRSHRALLHLSLAVPFTACGARHFVQFCF